MSADSALRSSALQLMSQIGMQAVISTQSIYGSRGTPLNPTRTIDDI
ncbi:hypothetical protein Vi05172_g11131 [Venturia inaequalis]|nr:hypothetical protein Vi05172_g11131 [Venturia inaequalis]